MLVVESWKKLDDNDDNETFCNLDGYVYIIIGFTGDLN